MSEPKFTKGPYRLDPYDCYSVRGYSTGTAKYPEKDGELVDSVLCSFNSHLLQTEANISLFLVAPEMYANEEDNLEILEALRDYFNGMLHNPVYAYMRGDLMAFARRLSNNISKTKTALAKARGEE